MEFLKDIALTQSIENYRLVILVLTLSSVIFVPYICFTAGSLMLSFRYLLQAKKENNTEKLGISFLIADLSLNSKKMVFFLGIIPGTTLVLSFAQILQSTPAISVTLAGFGFLFIAIGLWLSYDFKEIFHIQIILSSYQNISKNKDNIIFPDIGQYENEKEKIYKRSGKYGIIFLFAGLFLFSSAFQLAANPSSWPEVDLIWETFISFSAWMKFIELLALSAGLTGFGVLRYISSRNVNLNEASKTTLSKTCIVLAVSALIALPIFLLMQISDISTEAMAGSVYLLAGIGVLLFFTSAHFLYAYQKSSLLHYSTGGFLVFLFAVFINLVSGSISIGTATREHAAVLSVQYDKNLEELKSSLGFNPATFTGEDIYNTRCSSCHLFDQKKVGPPYIQTIPKYFGKKNDLVSFILNPVKKNPDFPPMTNPGLKQAEADSVAAYLIQKISSLVPKQLK